MDGKYAITVEMGDTLVISLLGFKTQEWKVSETQKDFLLETDCASIQWDGYKIFRRHSLSLSTLYTNSSSFGGEMKYKYNFEPFSCNEYGSSVSRRLSALFDPSISYIKPDFKSNQSQLIAIGVIDKGYSFYVRPIRSSLSVYGTAGYYFDFDKRMKYLSNNFKFDINLNLSRLRIKLNDVYNISFSGGYSFFINATKYNNVFFSISLNKNSGYMIGGDGCSHIKPKCKWYDKIFF